jgi:hypothetical protein
MADKRMFTKKITESDAFLDMPLSTQALYFHLNMSADDDGFVNNPKKIQRMIGASEDDMKLLIAKSFIIVFDSGIIVIKHWKMHNYIQNDRYKPTAYQDEKSMLALKENKSYTLLDTECIQNGYSLDAQYRLGKDRLDKSRVDKDKEKEKKEPVVYDPDELLNQSIIDFIDFRKKIKSPMTDRAITLMLSKLNKMTDNNDEKIEILNQSIINGWKGIFPLKETKSKSSFDDFQKLGEEWLSDRARVHENSGNN